MSDEKKEKVRKWWERVRISHWEEAKKKIIEKKSEKENESENEWKRKWNRK